MRTFFKRWFRRVYPQKQTSLCLNGHPITERWRRPCVECGSLNRTVSAFADDALGAKDVA